MLQAEQREEDEENNSSEIQLNQKGSVEKNWIQKVILIDSFLYYIGGIYS